MKPLAVIMDRDGTLASLHNAPETRDNQAWKEFNNALRFDAVVPTVEALLRSIRPGVVRIMVSGRMEGDFLGDRSRRLAMIDWIVKHQLPIDHLFMRSGGDNRKDSVIKEEILVRDILPNWDPVVAIDDRPEVLEVWKKFGIHTIPVVDPKIRPPITQAAWVRYWNNEPRPCMSSCKLDPLHTGVCFR